MKSYFDKQKQLLEKDALLFAKKYPEHARHLNLESLDDRYPNIERLLEGVAYLTAQIKQSIDKNTNSITETFLETLYPDCLKPWPSKVIGQFSYDEHNPQNKEELLTTESSL